MQLEVSGTAEVARSLERLADDLDDLKQPDAEIAAQAATLTRRSVPRGTGRLSQSVRGSVERGNRAVVTVGNASAPYARYVAHGTRYMPASAFPRQVDRRLEDTARAAIERGIELRIRVDGLA